jgi:hypothetical protein
MDIEALATNDCATVTALDRQAGVVSRCADLLQQPDVSLVERCGGCGVDCACVELRWAVSRRSRTSLFRTLERRIATLLPAGASVKKCSLHSEAWRGATIAPPCPEPFLGSSRSRSGKATNTQTHTAKQRLQQSSRCHRRVQRGFRIQCLGSVCGQASTEMPVPPRS